MSKSDDDKELERKLRGAVNFLSELERDKKGKPTKESLKALDKFIDHHNSKALTPNRKGG